MKRSEIQRFFKFVFFSVSAGLVQILSFTLLTELTSLSYWACYLPALVLSVIWNFTLNRKFTFHSASNIAAAMLKVFLYYLVFTPLTTLLGQYLAESKGRNGYLVTGINMLLNFVTEYLVQRYWVFDKSMDSAAQK